MVSELSMHLHAVSHVVHFEPLLSSTCIFDRCCRHKDVGSPLFVVHIGDMTSVVVADPEMIKQITMQPKNDKSHYFMQKLSRVFGER